MLTAERLRELLRYELHTGKWYWLVDRSRRKVKAGDEAGYVNQSHSGPRRKISVDGQDHRASRLAVLYVTGDWPPADVDHRDRNTLNDIWWNLRPATRSQNQANRFMPRTKHFDLPTGVRRHGNKFRAEIGVDGRKHHGPSRVTKDEALDDRLAFEKKYQGEFAPPHDHWSRVIWS